MDFLTAYYKQSDARSVSLLLQQYQWRGRHVCFACLSEAKEGRAAAYMTEQLLLWFRELSGKQLTNLVEKEAVSETAFRKETLTERLQRLIARTDEELKDSGLTDGIGEVSLAGILCAEDVYILLQRGSVSAYLLNTSFGKTCVNRLGQSQSGNCYMESGVMEQDVGILFVTDSFWQTTGEKRIEEGLCLGQLCREESLGKHLAELGAAGEFAAGSGMAAVLVKSCGDVKKSGNTGRNGEKKQKKERRKERRKIREKGEALRQRKSRTEAEKQRVGADEREWEKSCGEWTVKKEHGPIGIGNCDYEVLCLLGQGAFAKVYKVRDKRTEHIFACKVSPHKKILQKEFQVLKELRHPLFPRVYEYWEWEEKAVVKMEYIAGESLQRKLMRRKHFSAEQTIRTGMALAEGLLYLHERETPLLFRDVKPENIVITQQGGVKLLDFGCVCEAGKEERTKAGSYGFAAPEQFADRALTVAADVYGLGRTLEVMCADTGRTNRALRNITEACTQVDDKYRLPDMRSVLRALGGICKESNRTGFFVGRKYRNRPSECYYQKNIWESAYKRA